MTGSVPPASGGPGGGGDQLGARSIAFPALSTGAYGYPAATVERALPVALDARTLALDRRCLTEGCK